MAHGSDASGSPLPTPRSCWRWWEKGEVARERRAATPEAWRRAVGMRNRIEYDAIDDEIVWHLIYVIASS